MRRARVLVNGSFRGQRLTGQQRYADEVAQRLTRTPGFEEAAPSAGRGSSKAAVWAWVQLVLPVRAGRRPLLSLTARSPLWARRHVVVVHDLFAIEHPEWFSRAYYWTHAPLLRSQIRTASSVVAVSQPVADQLVALGRADVVVAPNAPSDVFAADDGAPSSTLAGADIEPGTCFVAVGSRDPRKNLAGLAEAYGLLSEEERRDHPLVLVGGGASIYRDQDIAWPAGTVQAGYVDDAELRRLYRDAASVVFPTLAEGFGLPLVEAAAAGTRSLVISDIEVFRWICGAGARYVDPTSPQSIADGLRAELADPTSPSIDPTRFTWEKSAETIADTCRRLVRST